MSGVVKIGYGYRLEDGTVLLSRAGVEAYVKHFISDLADANDATVIEMNDELVATYAVSPDNCLLCADAEEDNDELLCLKHTDTYEVQYDVVEIWDKVTVIS